MRCYVSGRYSPCSLSDHTRYHRLVANDRAYADDENIRNEPGSKWTPIAVLSASAGLTANYDGSTYLYVIRSRLATTTTCEILHSNGK